MDKDNNSIENNDKMIEVNKKSELSLDDITFKELILNKRREKIKADIFNLINKNMESLEKKIEDINSDDIENMNNSRSFNIDKFQDYFGERISIIQTIEHGNTYNKDSLQINEYDINNYDIKDKKKINNKIGKNQINLKKSLLVELIKNNDNTLDNKDNPLDTISETETVINNSNFDNIYNSLGILNNNNLLREIKNNINDSEMKKDSKIRNIDIQKSPRKNSINSNDNNLAKIYLKDSKNLLLDSTSTCNTDIKNKNKLKFLHLTEESPNSNNNLEYNKAELVKFFTEINLPSTYADKFIENGFDDLNVILALTKTSLAITNKNLKDIGIMKAGHRGQILIHLEERAKIFPFYLEKNMIYNNRNTINDSNYYLYRDNLFNFLCKIGCEMYVNNFRRNGYFNMELLLTQMLTRQPINKEMLIEDFCIVNENVINKIINGLLLECKNYIKGLKKIYKVEKLIFEDKIYPDSCGQCLIF